MTLLVRQFSCKHYDTACTPSSVIFAHCLTRLNDKSLCAISLITSILSHDYVMGVKLFYKDIRFELIMLVQIITQHVAIAVEFVAV